MAVERARDLKRDHEYLLSAKAASDAGSKMGEAAAQSILDIALYWMMGIPEEFVLVPLEPPEEMWDGLPRQIVMWTHFRIHSGRALHDHLKATGYVIPEWLTKEIPPTDQVPPKGTVAVCIYKAMLIQRPIKTKL